MTYPNEKQPLTPGALVSTWLAERDPMLIPVQCQQHALCALNACFEFLYYLDTQVVHDADPNRAAFLQARASACNGRYACVQHCGAHLTVRGML